MVPGLVGKKLSRIQGKPRTFTGIEGFFVALAGQLFEGGVRRQNLGSLFSNLHDLAIARSPLANQTLSLQQQVVTRPESVLSAIYDWAELPSYLFLGDGIAVQLNLGSIKSGWFEPRTGILLHQDYHPKVTICANMSDLVALFKANKRG